MNQSFDGRAQLHKGSERCNPGNFTLYAVVFLELFDLAKPRIFTHLFDGQAEPVFVDSDDLSLDLIADFDVFTGVFDALPRDFADVDQAFDAVHVHERPKIDNAGYYALYDIADLQFGQA